MSTTVQESFGPTYEPTLWDLRKRVAAARKADEKLVFVTVTAPITSEVIEVAIESGSLYLVGVRAGDKTWWEFAPNTSQSSPGTASDSRPRLPNSRWIMVGGLRALSSYRALRLDWYINEMPGAVGQIVYADSPIGLLRFFRRWDGQLTGYDSRLSLCVLIFSICEALRFRSIENTCARWIRPIGADPVLLITKEAGRRAELARPLRPREERPRYLDLAAGVPRSDRQLTRRRSAEQEVSMTGEEFAEAVDKLIEVARDGGVSNEAVQVPR